jgi:hypothetical protein
LLDILMFLLSQAAVVAVTPTLTAVAAAVGFL